MTDTHTERPPAHSAIRVLAALAELGQATSVMPTLREAATKIMASLRHELA